jgi:dTDP-4-amino-4,6-dideoxygalactose transaminase
LQHIDEALARRKQIDATYRELLSDIPGIRCLPLGAQKAANHAYFPILVESDYSMSRDALYQKLRDHEIWARRYFYPLISEFPMYRGLVSATRSNLPVAADASLKVLCLPIYPALSDSDIERIASVVRGR